MLTPSFDVCQDDAFVSISIRVPYVKISEAEIHFEGFEFRFYCKPYFLHLHLPGELAADGREKSSYDVDTSTVVVKLPKREHGQHFTDLGMLTTLLPRKPSNVEAGVQPLIEVVDCKSEGDSMAEAAGAAREEEEEFDWSVEQTIPSDNEAELLSGLVAYGFAQRHRGVFLKLQDIISSIVDCPDPDHMTSCERRLARLAHEEASFNQDHYLADLMDNEYIQILLTFDPPWRAVLAKWRDLSSSAAASCKKGEPGPDIISFTPAQRDQLKALPNREYLLDKGMKRSLYLGLVDIIFAYAYQHRTTEGDSNVESSWTICKLSSTLCWLEEFHGSVHEVVLCCLRRALCYPLYRHWQLALAVLQDTRDLFRLGRRQLLGCVLECIVILNSSEPYYLLNNLYLTDYAIWLQRASAKQIQRLADELDEVKLEAGSVGWDLVELEQAALTAVREAEEGGGDQVDEEGNDGDTQPQEVGEASCIEDKLELLTSQLQATSLTGKSLIEELEDTVDESCTSTSSESETSEVSGTSSRNETSSSSSGSGNDSESEVSGTNSVSGTSEVGSEIGTNFENETVVRTSGSI